MGKNWDKRYSKYQKKRNNQQIIFTEEDVFSMMNDTKRIIINENTTRLSEMGSIISGSGKLVDSVEFYNWLNQNYSKSGIFESSNSMRSYISKSQGNEKWIKTIIQGKGYEFDYMTSQRKMFKNLFKSFDAGCVANRPSSDIIVYDSLTGVKTEQQLKAYTSKNIPHLKNTPKDMTIVTNAEKVEVVKNGGYNDVVSFGDNKSIEKLRDSRLEDIYSGKATSNYEVKNVGITIAKAGMFGFAIGLTIEGIASYKKWREGKINTYDYLKELMKSGGNASVTSMFSAGVMIPITAKITTAGVSSLITFPITFIITSAIDKVVAPMFARGDYKRILDEAIYYKSLAECCNSLVKTMNNTTLQYSKFVDKIVLQQKEFTTLAENVISQQAIDDFEYYASLSNEEINKVISGMIELLDDMDSMYDSLKEQNWFQRMVRTLIGKNKVTKEEIQKNNDRLRIYVSKAVEKLYHRQCISEEVLKIHGNEINYLLKEQILIKKSVSEHEILLNSFNQRIGALENTLLLVTNPNLEDKIVSIKQIIDEEALKKYQEAEKLFMSGKLIDAFSLFEDTANKGIGKAYYYLGEYFINGYGHIKEDEARAIEYWRKGMELGDPFSTYQYGLLKNINNYDQSIKWIDRHIYSISKLAKEGNASAIYVLGNDFIARCNPVGGLDIYIDAIADANQYLKIAAQKGYWPAAFQFYAATESVRKSGIQIPNYVNKFLEVEWYNVHYTYAMMETCLGSKDYNKCAQHFQKALWLREDKIESAGFLAFLLNAGVVQDSIANGYSKNNMTMYYDAGLKSEDEAMLFQVGLLYFNGINKADINNQYGGGIGQDKQKAYEYLFKCYSACEKKSKQNQPVIKVIYGSAAWLLGMLYMFNEGIQMNSGTAVQYFKKGHELGDPMSTNLLSACYREGWGVDKNINKAEELIKNIK